MRYLTLTTICVLVGCSNPPSEADGGAVDDSDAAHRDLASDLPPYECTVERPTECPSPAPRYADVEPIFATYCVTCHDGTGDEWPLTSYSHVADWFDLIPPEVANCRMPPPEERLPMSDDDRVAILAWFKCGFPE